MAAPVTDIANRINLLQQANNCAGQAVAQETPQGNPHVAIEHYLSAMELLVNAVGGDLFQLYDSRKPALPGQPSPPPEGSLPQHFNRPESEVYLQSLVQYKLNAYGSRVAMLQQVACESISSSSSGNSSSSSSSKSECVTSFFRLYDEFRHPPE